ncbi:AraC family transcriptional regulator [Flavobacterium selenitireducens]|uniref:AraC family transcriptional regulator n=1 Tax=Flavobacterium selenitireducens TaxID=2722704 RepID=UPI00168AACBC|nr:AraC family transcriptional regulator [Flavobacterium selenitireducens]MBD3581499.1 helix-turn-helix transcriptional regulator [Flavobacterium selenitireducens]
MKLHIKNMVCDRCKMVVRDALEQHGLTPLAVSLGEVELSGRLSDAQKSEIGTSLKKLGFEIIDDKKLRTAEKIKTLIISLVHQQETALKVKLSDFLASELKQDYSALSNLFSQQTGNTIERFHILQKIERAKELLQYDELNLAEIASELRYSDPSHFTRQFKKVTGVTPSEFKASQSARTPLNRL